MTTWQDTAASFEPRLALASLSGRSDADWAKAGSRYAGAAFLGGIAIDDATRAAARKLVDRDREEFLPADPVAFVDSQLRALEAVPIRPGINIRTTSLEPLRRIADICSRRDAILEINAHCRQDEMCEAGAGERLLTDTERLCRQVEVASGACAPVSVKVRAEVAGVDLPGLARRLEDAGATFLHVDAMDSEPVIADIAEASQILMIANNGVRDRATTHEYLAYGADAVSVGRPSNDPAVLDRVRMSLGEWGRERGEHAGAPAEETEQRVTHSRVSDSSP